jgi:hypothetical protein
MITFYQFLESQAPQAPPPQKNKITQRPVPVGGFGGWKIHLRTGLDDDIRDRAYAMIQSLIKHDGGGKWQSKKLDGGEPDDKDITLYCGPKSEAIKAANGIKNHQYLYSLIKPPKPASDVSKDDIEILPKIYGRFNAPILNTAPFVFHQYGCKGWSMLASDMEKLSNARSLKDPKNSHLVKKLKTMGSNFDINFDLEKGKEDACSKSYKILSLLFGKDFTG